MTKNIADNSREATNPLWFREVLGHFPTGVCVVTGTPPGGTPTGMSVSSFSSVSLDPPLVAFFPDKSASTWLKISEANRFCVNILAANQESVCRQFASKRDDRFEGIDYRMSTSGLPIIENSVAWIECDIYSVNEAGDHYAVIGAVKELHKGSGAEPLVFFQGAYGSFTAK